MAKKKAANKKITALARRAPAEVGPVDTTPMGIMQRMARDPKLTVEKLERLIALNERMMDRTAASEFIAAYDAMVLDVPVISKKGVIKNKSGAVQSRYAKFEDIQRVIKPILKRFGFSLSYRTEWPDKLVAEVVGVLTHSGGHMRESRFRSPADDSGGKNAIQGLGSANAYGRRYVTIDLLNIVCEGVDDDGRTAPPLKPREDERSLVEQRQETRQTAPPAPHVASGEPITDGQRKRLFAILKSSGRSEVELKTWLQGRYGWTSTSQVTRAEYDYVVKCIEASGALPFREPGE